MESSPPADPFGLVGTLLERKYRVDRVVAEGGFGVVYQGLHIGLDVKVAVKVLRPEHGIDPGGWADAMARFLLEAKAIARVRHPSVVDVLDAGVASIAQVPGGVPWMVLEWIEGETLQAHLAKRRGQGGRSPEETLRFLRPVLEAIARAHEVSITHRDLKPSNIMVTPRTDGGVDLRVLDFGIAKLMGDDERGIASGQTNTDTDRHVFSIACAAPEQVSRTRTGPWTDVYALALLVTEVLTDQPGYPENDHTARLSAVFDATRPTPKKSGVDVGAWEEVLAKALSVRPADRQPDAVALLAELERTLDGTARPAVLPLRVATTVRPRRWRAVALSVVLLGAAGGTVAWARSRHHASSADIPAASCSSNEACVEAAGGKAAVCRRSDGRCVALESPDCRVLADPGALAKDDTVWLGAMFPQTGPDADEFGRIESHGVDVARRDFDQVMSSTDDQRGDDAARRFGVVLCDDAADPARAAKHLVDDVGVPAILGFKSGMELIELAGRTFIPKGVLSVATLSTNPLVTHVPQAAGEPRLVWRTTYDGASTAYALAAFATETIAPTLHEPLRVALIRPQDAMGAAHADAMAAALRQHDPQLAGDPSRFADVTYDSARADDPAESAHVVDRLLALRPHVVLFAGVHAVVDHALAPLEARWPASAPRPVYATFAVFGTYFHDFITADPSRRKRLFGVWPASSTQAGARFVTRYREVYPDDGVTSPTSAPLTTYDAFYVLAYASFAIPRGELVTGANLARAIPKLLPSGRTVDVGLAGIFDAYADLSQGKNVDLVGATGPMDFDPTTGEAPLDQAILCAAPNAPDGDVTPAVESGLVYAAATGHLHGKMKCP
jgi:ABC-type branched-subunit amino acid transport system substrate-binding protein/tRNA A-37 threonylcarbamoyl transferase component Bud32